MNFLLLDKLMKIKSILFKTHSSGTKLYHLLALPVPLLVLLVLLMRVAVWFQHLSLLVFLTPFLVSSLPNTPHTLGNVTH